MYIALGQGQTAPRGQNFDVYRNDLSIHSFVASFKQISVKSDFIQIFFMILYYVYSPKAGADNPLGMKFLCQQEHLVTLVICCSFQKNLFEVWFYTIFFMILYMYIAWGRGRQPPGDKVLMSTEMSCHFIHCCKFQKNVFKVWFYTIFFMIKYMYIAPGQGQTAPRGQNFDVNRNDLSLHSFVASLKRNLCEVWFYTIFFHDFIHVYSPKAGADNPMGMKFLCQRNILSLWSYVASFKKISLKSDFIQFFSGFYTCI